MNLILIVILAALALAIAIPFWAMRKRGMDRWIRTYAATTPGRREPQPHEPVHLLLCIADHFEPRHLAPSSDAALARVERWAQEYPKLFSKYSDSDGVLPQHTFFYPLEEYEQSEMDRLARLCAAGFGEVEVHLHHDHDTADSLRARLEAYTRMLASRHGLLARRSDGRVAYGFVHGNWALDNSRPDGRWCGVNNELDVLRETGCYADFTMPSAPSPTQTSTINSIYWAVDDPLRPKSHDRGRPVGGGPAPDRALMMIQGPLLLDWNRRKWGLAPRIENGCIQRSQPPTMARLDQWLKARVQVHGRPDWFFVKLHTHGATDANQQVLLGETMTRFHDGLARRAQGNRNFHFHYVTARQMYNLARAAEAGWQGDVAGARDFELQTQSPGTPIPGSSKHPHSTNLAAVLAR